MDHPPRSIRKQYHASMELVGARPVTTEAVVEDLLQLLTAGCVPAAGNDDANHGLGRPAAAGNDDADHGLGRPAAEKRRARSQEPRDMTAFKEARSGPTHDPAPEGGQERGSCRFKVQGRA